MQKFTETLLRFEDTAERIERETSYPCRVKTTWLDYGARIMHTTLIATGMLGDFQLLSPREAEILITRDFTDEEFEVIIAKLS